MIMAKTFVNSFAQSPFTVQAFDDSASLLTRCSAQSLKSILDKDEARASQLDVNAYHQAVDEFCNVGKQDDKLMIVAFEKGSDSPAGMVLLKKKAYDPVHLRPLGGHQIEADMRRTTRKLYWELSYCIRRADQRSMCLGDICISCGIEEVYNRAKNHPHGASTFIWLILAGGFKNTPALRLYLAHGFDIIGLHAGAVMMALCNVDDGSVRKTSKQVVNKLESTFLLPSLKQSADSQNQRSGTLPLPISDQNSQEPGTSGLQDPTSAGHENEEPDSQHSTVAAGGGFVPLSQESNDSNEEDPASQRSKRRRVEEEAEDRPLPRSLSVIVGGSTTDDLEEYISTLEFRSFEENLRCLHSLSVIKSRDNETQADMLSHIESMERNIAAHGQYHSLLQKLQISKQLEYLSNLREEHVLNTAKWLTDDGRTSLSYSALKDIINTGWAVYRYPVLGQVKLGWAVAKSVIPAAANLFDKKVEANESLPANVIRAQESRCDAPYLRVSLEFPSEAPGDGDGLCSLEVTNIHGFYINDDEVHNLERELLFRKVYPSDLAQVGVPEERIEMRSRLIGFDTQEAPRDPGRRDCNVPQHFWREGRQFLQQELNSLRGEVPIDRARILGDCYGVDLYGRMLLDIRAVYDESVEGEAPTLRRLEMAEKALRTGYAFPTNHYLVTDDLWEIFQQAIRQRKGAFGSELAFVHPCICRKARHQLEVASSRNRRHRYAE